MRSFCYGNEDLEVILNSVNGSKYNYCVQNLKRAAEHKVLPGNKSGFPEKAVSNLPIAFGNSEGSTIYWPTFPGDSRYGGTKNIKEPRWNGIKKSQFENSLSTTPDLGDVGVRTLVCSR